MYEDTFQIKLVQDDPEASLLHLFSFSRCLVGLLNDRPSQDAAPNFKILQSPVRMVRSNRPFDNISTDHAKDIQKNREQNGYSTKEEGVGIVQMQ